MLRSIDFKGVKDRRSYPQVVAHLLRRVQTGVAGPFAKRYEGSAWAPWAAAAQAYVLDDLSAAQRITMFAYTTQEYHFVQEFLRGGRKHVNTNLITPPPSALRTEPQTQWLSAAYNVLAGAEGEAAWPGPLGDTVRREWAPLFAPRSATQAQARANWEAWTVWLRARALNFPAELWEAIHACSLKASWEGACVFLPQSRVLCDALLLPGAPLAAVVPMSRVTPSRFRALLPHMGEAAWRAVLTQFVADMDAIIAGAPPLPTPMRVFRGLNTTGGRGELRAARTHAGAAGAGYTSTTLSRSVAGQYTDDDHCCIESVTLPPGARVLPMWPISQYANEVEVLLPRLRP